MALAVCFHLHCYQPERSDPWLDIVKPELGAFPYHNWNQRITAECYRPNTAAAVLAPDQRLRVSTDNFAIASFDVVRTLHRWLAANAPDVDAVLRAAARARRSTERRGARVTGGARDPAACQSRGS